MTHELQLVDFSYADVTKDMKIVFKKCLKVPKNETIRCIMTLKDNKSCSFLVGRSYFELIANLLFKTGKFLQKNENNTFLDAIQRTPNIFYWTLDWHLKFVKYIMFFDMNSDDPNSFSRMMTSAFTLLEKKGRVKYVPNLSEILTNTTKGLLMIPFAVTSQMYCGDEDDLELSALTCPLIVNILRYSTCSIKVVTVGQKSALCLGSAFQKLKDDMLRSSANFTHSIKNINSSACLASFFMESTLQF